MISEMRFIIYSRVSSKLGPTRNVINYLTLNELMSLGNFLYFAIMNSFKSCLYSVYLCRHVSVTLLYPPPCYINYVVLSKWLECNKVQFV